MGEGPWVLGYDCKDVRDHWSTCTQQHHCLAIVPSNPASGRVLWTVHVDWLGCVNNFSQLQAAAVRHTSMRAFK